MAQSPQKSSGRFLQALVDKGRRFLRTQDLPGDLQNSANVSTSPPTTSQKRFKRRGDDAGYDIKVLAMTYILQDNPILRELIQVIIGFNNRNENKLSDILNLSVTFTVQLISFHEEHPSEALTAMMAFLKTMRNIDGMARDTTECTNRMNDVMNGSIKEIKNAYPSLSDRDWSIGGGKGLSGIVETIIGTAVPILDLLSEASDTIPVPFVKPAVTIVASLLKAVQQTRSNADDMRQVATVAGEFVVMLAVTCAEDGMKPSPRFQQALDIFQNKLENIAKQCDELSHRNVLWRFLQQGADQSSLSSIKQDLQNAVQQFQIQSQILQNFDLRSLGQVINRKLDEDAVNALPKPVSYVGRRDEYLPGSRSDVIQIIADWIENSDQPTFWMRGGAGLGKSTLAHTIVKSLQADGRLATLAFLVRGSACDPATVIQTMARELGELHPRAIPEVATAARTCNSSHRPLREYIELYLINPIRSLSHSYPLVIVIDGLDEWDHHEAFLEQLEHISQSSVVKFLLISRPNYSIERSLLKVPAQKYDLPPVSQAITEEYFNYHFARMDWKTRKPSRYTISNLAHLADGLLIWAAMVCSLLSYQMGAGAPHELLEQILSSGKQIALKGQLSNLYCNVLRKLFRDDEEQELFRRVFGAMTVLQESLPLHDFARLLGMSDHQVRGVQSQLTALQTRGKLDDSTVPPASERFHSSFVEFTMNLKAEAGDALLPYLINPQMAHELIGEGCLAFLNDFQSSFRGSQCIHSDLHGLELYAVKCWPLHVANSNDRFTALAPKLENLLFGLAEKHMRQWGSWFLANLAVSPPAGSHTNWDEVLGDIDKEGFYCSLADLLRNNMSPDTTIALRRTSCLEIAVRLQPQRVRAWENLGDSYQQRFDGTGNLDLLNNAITVHRHALGLRSKDESCLISMSGLAFALRHRSRKTGSLTDLEEAISLYRQLLFPHLMSHPDRAIPLSGLAVALVDRFKKTGSMIDLEEAISMHRKSLSLRPAPHPDRLISLINLAYALRNRFRGTGSVTDLEEAISTLRELLPLCLAPHPARPMSLGNLAAALYDRFRKTDSMTDLEDAILLFCESLSLRPMFHPDHSISLSDLATALAARFEKTGSMTDLEEAISMHRESLSLRPVPHPDRSTSLINLASALRNRFRGTGSVTDLEESIAILRESLLLCLAPHPARPTSLSSLAASLDDRFRKIGSMTDLEEAISMHRESLSLRPAPHPDRFISLSYLATALGHLFQKTGLMTDLEEAISTHRALLALRPVPHPDRSTSLINLASALRNRFRGTGSVTDLEESISMLRESLLLCLAPHPARPTSLSSLAVSLNDRFRKTDSITDLEEAISMHRESLSLCPTPHPDRPTSLSDLATALGHLFQKTGLMTDLEEAISMLRESFFLKPASRPIWILTSLRSALETWFKENKDQSDLDQAISLLQELLAIESA